MDFKNIGSYTFVTVLYLEIQKLKEKMKASYFHKYIGCIESFTNKITWARKGRRKVSINDIYIYFNSSFSGVKTSEESYTEGNIIVGVLIKSEGVFP